MKNIKAAVWIPLVIILTVLGGGGYWATKKGIFNHDVQRAKEEVKTTQVLTTTTTDAMSKGSSVLTAIGEANAGAPDSKQKEFISQAVPIGVSLLGPPNQQFLTIMQQLENATLKGKVQEQAVIIKELQADAGDTRNKYAQAVAAKQRADDASLQAAEREAAANADKLLAFYIAAACGALYIWAKVTHFSPGQIATFVGDVRNEAQAEMNPVIQKLDGVATPIQQKIVKFLHKIS